MGDSGDPWRPINVGPRLQRLLGQPCICGQEQASHTEAGRRFYLCCAPTYFGEDLVALGPVWFDRPIVMDRDLTPEDLLGLAADAGTAPFGMTTALYRRFDVSRHLLYVGISDELPARIRVHERRSAWSVLVVHRSVEWFASRELAAAAEVRAIKKEMPLFNQKHATAAARAALIEYLSEPGRLRLIAATQAAASTPQT